MRPDGEWRWGRVARGAARGYTRATMPACAARIPRFEAPRCAVPAVGIIAITA
jgi:hypothetical protein